MKTRVFSCLLLFLCSCQFSFSQDTLQTVWVKKVKSPISNGNAEAWAIGTDATGNPVWGVNLDMPGLFEFFDVMVFKLDTASNVIWVDTSAFGPFAQQSYNLVVTDSLIYIGGRTCSSIDVNFCDALLFTVQSATGTTGWNFTWDQGFGYEEIDGIALLPDGIILTGWTDGNGTEVDGLLLKIDYAGNVFWQKPFLPSMKDDHFDGHLVADDSMIYVCGLYNGSPLLGWEGRSLLAKFDIQDGSFVDSIHFGRQDFWVNAENALGMTSDGNYLYVTGYTTPAPNNWDIYLAKFDKNLNQMWYKTWGGPLVESARAIAIGPDGAIYIGGNTNGFGNGGTEIALLKFSEDGNFDWYKTWGAAGDDQTLDIHIRGNNLYLTGKSTSFHPSGKSEAILLKAKLESATPSKEQIQYPVKLNVSVYPNPVSDEGILTFQNPEHQHFEFELYNSRGQLVEKRGNVQSDVIKISKGSKAPGLYFYKLQSCRGGVGQSGKVLMQ